MINMEEELALRLTDPLPFGKHKDKLISEVIAEGEADYLQYLLENNEDFHVTSDVIEIIENELNYYSDTDMGDAPLEGGLPF